MKRLVMFGLAGILGLGLALVVPPGAGPFGSVAVAAQGKSPKDPGKGKKKKRAEAGVADTHVSSPE